MNHMRPVRLTNGKASRDQHLRDTLREQDEMPNFVGSRT